MNIEADWSNCGAVLPMVKWDVMNDPTTESEELVNLYHRAFAEYGAQALWNMRPLADPTPADALAITKALRTHGGMAGRRLAEQIERICLAPH